MGLNRPGRSRGEAGHNTSAVTLLQELRSAQWTSNQTAKKQGRRAALLPPDALILPPNSFLYSSTTTPQTRLILSPSSGLALNIDPQPQALVRAVRSNPVTSSPRSRIHCAQANAASSITCWSVREIAAPDDEAALIEINKLI